MTLIDNVLPAPLTDRCCLKSYALTRWQKRVEPASPGSRLAGLVLVSRSLPRRRSYNNYQTYTHCLALYWNTDRYFTTDTVHSIWLELVIFSKFNHYGYFKVKICFMCRNMSVKAEHIYWIIFGLFNRPKILKCWPNSLNWFKLLFKTIMTFFLIIPNTDPLKAIKIFYSLENAKNCSINIILFDGSCRSWSLPT